MLALELAGGKAAAFRFLDALKLVLISNNLGDTKSLVTHPATTTHQRLTPSSAPRSESATVWCAFRSVLKTLMIFLRIFYTLWLNKAQKINPVQSPRLHSFKFSPFSCFRNRI